jgi:hypothetical protein
MSRRIAALAVLALSLPAAETIVADLRFSGGIAPLPDEATGTYLDVGAAVPPGVVSGSPRIDTYEEDATAFAFDISVTHGTLAPVGLLYGGSLRYCNGEMQLESIAYPDSNIVDTAAEFEAQGYQVDSNSWATIGLAGHLGLGWAITPEWHVEAVGILGIDWVTIDTFSVVPGSSETYANEGRGLGWTWGGRFGAYWTDPETSWQFGALAEWTTTEGTVKTDYADNSVEFDAEAAGLGLRVVIGRRF